ncbi:ATP-binding cassette domain-containing protein [Streptomyces sp. NPDC047974]|uniref:ATP-binding cassette domain-containing protein n=1 Tax=Streptomyces sp. NPDC047974 TaxID=3154343 RepID=UPI0033FE1861
MTEHHPALRLSRAGAIRAGGTEAGYVIENVSFACERGTWTALTGPSAADRTGVLRCAAGLDRPTEGEVRLAEGLRLAHLGLLPAADRPAGAGTLAAALGLLPPEGAAALGDAMRRLDLWEERDTPVDDLTERGRRAAAVALAVADSPDVLIADGLTRGLPADSAAAVLDVLRDAVDRRGLCVLASAEDLASLERADAVVLLAAGRVVETRVMP